MLKSITFYAFLTLLCCTGNSDPKKGSESMHKYTNRLAGETSPYLLQHAHNPVDWYPWGEEAFRKAKEENKPVFLSIGYAACHWCHVMEEESFENEETARLMNELYVCIKVDREERPDVDQVYMTFVQMFTGSGGWPLSVFLTPDQIPFYGGTYFPPEDRYGRPGFKKLLRLVADHYHNDKTKLAESISEIQRAFQHSLLEKSGQTLPDRKLFERACDQLSRYYDPEFGGIGKAPKFPASQTLSLFLRRWHLDGEEKYLDMVTQTLTRMRYGGIYDQIGGGFARYSVDEKWLVPHFEKMLYDNGQLASLYLDAWCATQNPLFMQTAEEILEFVSREMMDPQGGFYASFDADSEGEEGRYYLWEKKEIIDLLGKENGEIFCNFFGVSAAGNFEGRNILHIQQPPEEWAEKNSVSPAKINEVISVGKEKLFKRRSARVAPMRDEKIILAWNALMLSSYARAFQITGKQQYKQIIRQNVAFVERNLSDGSAMFHSYKDNRANITGFLDDYALWIQALLDSYEAVFDSRLAEQAIRLLDYVEEKFTDEAQGGYFYTSKSQAALIHRLKDEGDQSIPSGTGIMLMNLLRVYLLTGNTIYLEKAENLFRKYGASFAANPYGYASYLNALDFYLNKPAEIVVVHRAGQNPAELLKSVSRGYFPNTSILAYGEGQAPEFVSRAVTEGRKTIEGKPTAYICRDFACGLPVTDPGGVIRQVQDIKIGKKVKK